MPERVDEGHIRLDDGTLVAIASLPVRGPMPFDDFEAYVVGQMERLTRQAAAGTITLLEWEAQMRALIRDGVTAADMLGRDGRPYRVFERFFAWARRRRVIADQYAYLSRFADQLRGGAFDEESQLGAVLRRVALYAGFMRVVFEEARMREAKRRGDTTKQRILEPGAEHCIDCLIQAALGEVPIDDPRVTPIGVDVDCGTSDKCTIKTR